MYLPIGEWVFGAVILCVWWAITAFLAPRIFPRMDDGTALLIVCILTGITLPLLYIFIMNVIFN